MAWRIEVDPGAEKELRKLGREPARRILRFLADRIAPLDDPRSVGEALKGSTPGSSGSTASATIESSPTSKTDGC